MTERVFPLRDSNKVNHLELNFDDQQAQDSESSRTNIPVDNDHGIVTEILPYVDDLMISNAWDRVADIYYRHKTESRYIPDDLIVKPQLVRAIVNGGYIKGRFLGFGSGTGWLESAVEKENAFAEMIGTDISPRMVKIANQHSRKHKLKVRYQLAAADSSNFTSRFDSESFDVIGSSNALDCMRDPSTAIKNAYDLLKPGGKLIFSIRSESRNAFYCQNGNIPYHPRRGFWVSEKWEGTNDSTVPRQYMKTSDWFSLLSFHKFTVRAVVEPYAQEDVIDIDRDIYARYNMHDGRSSAAIYVAQKL